MNKMVIFLLVLPGILLGGRIVAQKKDNNNQPDVKIDVKKQYDEKGNMVVYDSIYSWSWSGNPDDMDIDSLMNKFRHHLEIYNYYDGDIFPHSFILPQFPDVNPESFFGTEDSILSWDFNNDTTLKNFFFDDFFYWNFIPYSESLEEFFDDFLYGFHKFRDFPEWNLPPFSPHDTTGYKKLPSPFLYDYFLYQDLRDRQNNRHKKNQNNTKT
jgi:hypothetical protein